VSGEVEDEVSGEGKAEDAEVEEEEEDDDDDEAAGNWCSSLNTYWNP